MRIAALMPNLATNHIVRVAPILKALQRNHDVELIGVLKQGEELFPPFAHEFDYRIVTWDGRGGFLGTLREVEARIRGDLIYAFQAATFSVGAALLGRLRRRVPVIIDMADWEAWGMFRHRSKMRHALHVCRHLVGPGWRAPGSLKYRYLIDRLCTRADAITVVSTALQRRFGGFLLRHGPDTTAFDPARFDRSALRDKWGLPHDLHLILFAGTPSNWKGVDQLVAALDRLSTDRVRLVMAGKPFPLTSDKMLHLGFVPHTSMPELLTLSDLVVLPQQNHPMAESQIPNKAFEAMAMAKPIVASAVGDMGEVLDGCGVVVEPEDVAGLARGIERVLADREWGEELGRRAREKCVREYSWDAIERVLADVLRPFA